MAVHECTFLCCGGEKSVFVKKKSCKNVAFNKIQIMLMNIMIVLCVWLYSDPTNQKYPYKNTVFEV